MEIDNLAARVAQALLARKETLAVVETSAGGVATSALTAIPGGSAWFRGSVLPYANVAKTRLLGLSESDISQAGAVSAEAALMMARAVRDLTGAGWGAAETGIAGPLGSRRSSKPVGACYLAVVGPGMDGAAETVLQTTITSGQDDRAANRAIFATGLLTLVLSAAGYLKPD